jgi:tRNA G26 N,N-dimethylase Trm1
VKEIVVNDFEESAVELIRKNILYNGLDETKIRPNHGRHQPLRRAARANRMSW